MNHKSKIINSYPVVNLNPATPHSPIPYSHFPVSSFKHQVTKRHRPFFSLVELLIVIAVIMILLAILLPTLKNAKEFAKDAHCKNNLKQQAIAFNTYATDNAGWYPMAYGFDGNGNRQNSYQAGRYANRWWNNSNPYATGSVDGRPAQNFLTFDYLSSAEVWACPANQFPTNSPHRRWDIPLKPNSPQDPLYPGWKQQWQAGIFWGSSGGYDNYDSSYLCVRPLMSHGGGTAMDIYLKDGATNFYRKSHGSIGGNTLFMSIPVMPLSSDVAKNVITGELFYNSSVFTKYAHINHFNYSRVDGSIGESVVKGRIFGSYTQDVKDAIIRTRSDSGGGECPVFQGDARVFFQNCNNSPWTYPGPSTCRWYSW